MAKIAVNIDRNIDPWEKWIRKCTYVMLLFNIWNVRVIKMKMKANIRPLRLCIFETQSLIRLQYWLEFFLQGI
jgi:hypothetical protein